MVRESAPAAEPGGHPSAAGRRAALSPLLPPPLPDAELSLSLQFADPDVRALLPRHRVRRWLRHALERPAELTVRWVNLDEGRALNRDYRGRDYATNVLTFDYEQAPRVQADLVICAPVVSTEARAQGLDLLAHHVHLLIHGALHAQGWDHERAGQARRMEARESALMQRLGFKDPYQR